MGELREIDVEQLMGQVQEGTRGDRLESPSSNSLPPASDSGIGAEFASLHASHNIYNAPFSSHRWVLGAIVISVKKVLRRLLTAILTRQVTYNTANARIAIFLRDQLAGLNQEVFVAQAQKLSAASAEVKVLKAQVQELKFKVLTLGEEFRRAERTRRRILYALTDSREETTAEVKRRKVSRQILEPAFDYLGLAERFRGSEAEIKDRQQTYIEYFRGKEEVLDVGCGRGEFLELLKENGIKAKGVDADLDMVLLCQEKGLDVVRHDAIASLANLPDGSLGGIFSAQVTEHLEAAEVIDLVHLCYRKLRPGGVAIVETTNPRCLLTFAESFYLDFSHTRPVHPEAMKFLFESTGFRDIELKFSSPVEASMRIPPLPDVNGLRRGLEEFNLAIEKLNELLYGFQDYALVGRKGSVQS